jgi:3-hydroxy acid dehydrogenase / malonic semialdehyde reductase
MAPLVVITGASSGIGASAARRFSREGYRLVLLARRLDRLQALQKELASPATLFELDIRSFEKTSDVIDKIEKEVGEIDILLNNAGCGFGLEPAHKCRIEEWDQCVDTNIKGLLYCTRALLPYMVKRDNGHIINLGSIAGTYPYPGGNVYGATKAFVRQFSLNLRADLLGTQVRVSCIEPGLTEGTEFSKIRFRGDEAHAAQAYQGTKALHADDIAEVIYFCTTVAKHININAIELMPVAQASSPLAIHRT